MIPVFVRGFLLTACLWLGSAVALADDAGESRAAAFRAVQGAEAEQVPGGALMVAAYMLAIGALIGYVARLGLMQRRTQGELERLAASIAEHDRQG